MAAPARRKVGAGGDLVHERSEALGRLGKEVLVVVFVLKKHIFVFSTLAVTQAPPMTSSTSRLGNSFLANRFSSFTATFSEGGKEKYCRSSRIPRARRTNSLCAYFVPSGLVPLPAGERRGHG